MYPGSKYHDKLSQTNQQHNNNGNSPGYCENSYGYPVTNRAATRNNESFNGQSSQNNNSGQFGMQQPNFFNNINPHPNSYPDSKPIFSSIPANQPVPQGVENMVLSNCRGKKKALLIGINYFGQKGELRGCINDVKNIKNFLCQHYGFKQENMVILTDDQSDPKFVPTKTNMLSAMNWLVQDAQPNDSLFLHYSGHGGQAEDIDGDEEDGIDETVYPVDHQQAGMILDDEMNHILVSQLKQGVRLTAVFDSCHSGTAIDLPYVYASDGTLKKFNPMKKIASTMGEIGKGYMTGDYTKAIGAIKEGFVSFTSSQKASEKSKQTRASIADVVMFSGCKDRQTSADTKVSGVGNTGAMSHALISCLSQNPYSCSYHGLLIELRQFLKGNYSQLPVLSTGRPMDINSSFIM